MTNAPISATQSAADGEHIAPAPCVSAQAFCETVETAAAIQAAGEDRRLGKTHLKIQMGGITAAVESYSGSSTPNVIVIETDPHEWTEGGAWWEVGVPETSERPAIQQARDALDAAKLRQRRGV